jgi:hypothetical protein
MKILSLNIKFELRNSGARSLRADDLGFGGSCHEGSDELAGVKN